MTSTLAYSSLEGKTSIRSSNLTKAINDLRDGLNAWEVWGTLGWHDLRQRYRRSNFGPLWLTLSMGIMAGAIGVIYSEIFGQEIHDYLPFLAVGLIVWGSSPPRLLIHVMFSSCPRGSSGRYERL
jgi:hypothetical protein